jgi:hypothetical protein
VPTAAAPSPSAIKAKRICDWLVRDKLLRPEQAEAVLTHMQRSGGRVEEAILELGVASEADLLKSLSAH